MIKEVIKIFLVLLLIPSLTYAGDFNKHNRKFAKYSKRFFGIGFDHKWFISQMKTDEEKSKSRKKHYPERKGWIATFIQTDREYYDSWFSLKFPDRLTFMFVSYYIGYKELYDAMWVCKGLTSEINCEHWDSLSDSPAKVNDMKVKSYIWDIFANMGINYSDLKED